MLIDKADLKKPKKTTKAIIDNKYVVSIIVELKKIKLGDELLFKDRINPPTKNLVKFQNICIALYEGRFFKFYKIDSSFYDVYNFKQSDIVTRNLYGDIYLAEHDWAAVQKFIVLAANNYKTFFKIGNEPRNKEYLPRNMDAFLFNSYNCTSYFILSLVKNARALNSVPNLKNKIVEKKLPQNNLMDINHIDLLHSVTNFLFYNKGLTKQISDIINNWALLVKYIDETLAYKLIKEINYSDFLNTKYWKIIVKKKKYDANNCCQLCNSSSNLNVHHKTYRHHGQEHNFLEDLIVLCQDCHSTFHHKLHKEKEANK